MTPQDRSGTIESAELYNALSQFGYSLSPRLIDILQKKYSESYRLPGFERYPRADDSTCADPAPVVKGAGSMPQHPMRGITFGTP